MGRIKGKYVATVTITLDVDENRSGLLPYEEIEQGWKRGLNDGVKAAIQHEIIDDDLGKLEVTQMYCEICRVEESVETTQPDHIADSDKKVSISCGHENDVIFREAAIEALARMMPRSYTPDGSHPADEEIFRAQEVFADCIEALEILPSAQPEIIRCKDCKYSSPNGKYGCKSYHYRLYETHEMNPDDFCSFAERRKDE